LEIKSIERFKGTQPGINPIETLERIAANATCAVGLTAPRPTVTATCLIQKSATAEAQEQLSIRIEPFTTATLDKALTNATEVLRLAISAVGHVYHTDVPPAAPHSNALQPVPPATSAPAFSAIYTAASAHLAVFNAAPLDSWLSDLPDATPLPALSMPGAHNAPTCHVSLPSVRCQAVSTRELLEHGVRFLDVRVCPPRPEPDAGAGGAANGTAAVANGGADHRPKPHAHGGDDDPLVLVHGAFPVSLTGAKRLGAHILSPVRAFLSAHPREAVVLSLKREGARSGTTDAQLARILRETYSLSGGDEPGSGIGSWWTEPHVPRLGEVRGRIVLLRRFALDDGAAAAAAGWGLDGAGWAFNADCDVRGAVAVQDRCEVLAPAGIDAKVEAARAHLERCAAVAFDDAPAPPLYLNFLSASNFWRIGCWPERIAARLNPAVLAHLCERHGADDGAGADWSAGVVVCDWVGLGGDWDLLRAVVGMNAKVAARLRAA
jgi:1-phosphatidylinositol phosphodiesterase